MPLVPITHYAAAWNPITNDGLVTVSVKNGPTSKVPVNTPEEFTILLLMLGKPGVMFDTNTKEIEIPIGPTGT